MNADIQMRTWSEHRAKKETHSTRSEHASDPRSINRLSILSKQIQKTQHMFKIRTRAYMQNSYQWAPGQQQPGNWPGNNFQMPPRGGPGREATDRNGQPGSGWNNRAPGSWRTGGGNGPGPGRGSFQQQQQQQQQQQPQGYGRRDSSYGTRGFK